MRYAVLLAFLWMGWGLSESQAQIVVYGTVTDQYNQPVSNQIVNYFLMDGLSKDTLADGMDVTGSSGMYSDTVLITPPSGSFLAKAFTLDCNFQQVMDSIVGVVYLQVDLQICVSPIPSNPPCNATFAYDDSLYAPQTQLFHFSPQIVRQNRSYFWSFGDGATANGPFPYHQYDSAGTYTACLTVSEGMCQTSTCQTIQVQYGGMGMISGWIFADSNYNDQVLDIAQIPTVYLLGYEGVSGEILTAVDSQTVYEGWYAFYDVPPGQYLVKAAHPATSLQFNDFAAAYHVANTVPGVLYWSNASSIQVGNGNWSHMAVDVHTAWCENPGGPASLKGLVTQGFAKTTAPGDALSGIQVLLLNGNGELVQHTYSDSEGRFGFTDLAYGRYIVYAEIPGLPTTPQHVTLTENDVNMTEPRVFIEVNTTYVDGYVNFPVSVEETLASSTGLSLFPQPAQDHVTLVLDESWDREPVEVGLTDVSGKRVKNWSFQAASQHLLDVGDLPAGLYVLEIRNKERTVVQKLMK